MNTLSSILLQRLQQSLSSAFGPEGALLDPLLRPSDHADFQANVALAFAQKTKRKPREVAQEIVSHLQVSDLCEKVELAGPGFINLTLKNEAIAQALAASRALEQARRPIRVVIDYSAPNVAKEMHVGHLRSTIIGDALARVFTSLGHDVVRQNHVGDWGTPFGMLIEHLVDLGAAQATELLSVGELNQFYKDARAKFDADPAFADRARSRVVKLQALDPETLSLWRLLVDKSADYFEKVYEHLGVLLTSEDLRGESFYNPFLEGVVKELEEKGLARLDQGALCVFPEGFKGREGEPLPLIIRKKEGGYGYATTDLAALRYRAKELGASRLLYVVGSPQQQHFAMVFKTGEMAGWLGPEVRAVHVSFGSILGTDKKMFKTRSGDTVRLVDLIDEAISRAEKVVLEKNPDLDPDTAREVGRKIGIGALKYADLSNDRAKDYVFDYDRMLSFEGNTGPYLQYAHARICSIFRRANIDRHQQNHPLLLESPEERALALHLLAFDDTVHGIAEHLELQKLCTYLFDLATSFMTFYERCSVLKAESDTLRASRLTLSARTAETLQRGLELLGIDAPERM